MPQPLKHIKDRQAKDPTAAPRMRMYRLRKAGHITDGNPCPKCREEMTRLQYPAETIDRICAGGCRDVTGRDTIKERDRRTAQEQAYYEWRKAEYERQQWTDPKLIFERITGVPVTTKEATRAAWVRHAAKIHPDRGGDPAAAASFGQLWLRLERLNEWKEAPRTVTPKPKSPTAIKRAVRFYVGMQKELDAVSGSYASLLTLHGGEGNYPWTSPYKRYRLPPTEAEFKPSGTRR